MKLNFKNKKILITGHTGFKGSWLTSWLKYLGANIMGISIDLPSSPSHFQACGNKKYIKSIMLDIRNLKKLKKKILDYKPDYIFHLAAQSLVSKSYTDPVKTWNTNLIGTLNILESLRYLKKKCNVILITSDKCYYNKELKRGYKEEDELGGKDPYSASKAAAEILIRAHIKSFFPKEGKIRISTARAGNVIGGGDWSQDRLIPDCIKCWSKNKSVILRNPNSTRPWQHVLEALNGYLVLASNLNKNKNLHSESFNFGPTTKKNFSVKQVINEMSKTWKNIKWDVKKNNRKFFYESNLLKLNCAKAQKKLKWKPFLNFNEMIELVATWYKSFYYKKSKMDKVTIEQIKKFEKLRNKY